jgi:hypothetical protein
MPVTAIALDPEDVRYVPDDQWLHELIVDHSAGSRRIHVQDGRAIAGQMIVFGYLKFEIFENILVYSVLEVVEDVEQGIQEWSAGKLEHEGSVV